MAEGHKTKANTDDTASCGDTAGSDDLVALQVFLPGEQADGGQEEIAKLEPHRKKHLLRTTPLILGARLHAINPGRPHCGVNVLPVLLPPRAWANDFTVSLERIAAHMYNIHRCNYIIANALTACVLACSLPQPLPPPHAAPPLHPTGNELCERLAYYGLSTNLIVYLTTVLGVSNAGASAQVGKLLHLGPPQPPLWVPPPASLPMQPGTHASPQSPHLLPRSALLPAPAHCPLSANIPPQTPPSHPAHKSINAMGASNPILQPTITPILTNSPMQLNIWSGTCYFTPLLGAFLADSYLGRFRVIITFSTIYLAGMTLLTCSASVPALQTLPGAVPTSGQLAFFWTAM